MKKAPVIAVICNRIDLQGASVHGVKHQYIRPLMEIVGAVPILIPAVGEDFDLQTIAPFIDGILLPGSPSMVAPACYGAEQKFGDHELDTERDETSFSLIKSALDLDIPVLAICRGLQEINVVLGGTLHQFVHEIPGKQDHRGDQSISLAERFDKEAHKVIVQKGGIFEKIGLPDEFPVNTLHSQGINKLGEGLRVEAVSEDGLVEAFSLPGKRFVVGVQWHPEANFLKSAPSARLFESFRDVLYKKLSIPPSSAGIKRG